MTTAAHVQSMPLRRSISYIVPPVLLALVVNGFWLYLGVLELVGTEPRTVVTAAYYAMLGLGLAASAWAGRETIRRRLSAASPLPPVWLAVAAALAGWFLLNVALLSSGVAARDAAALLVLSSFPSTLLVLALTRQQLRILTAAWVILALGLFLVSFVTLMAHPAESGRFSPIDELDPITAAHVAALGAIVLLIASFRDGRARLAQAAGVALLVGLAVIPASRGTLVALVVAIATLVAVQRKRLLPLLLPAVLVGFALGAAGSTVVGADYYYSIDIPGLEGRVAPPSEGEGFTGEGAPISSLAIRRYLWSRALRDSVDRPLFGHGVGMLVDEPLYSLEIPCLALFLGVSVLSVVALARLLQRGRDRFVSLLAIGFAAFTAVNAMVSGEIGSDASLWIALALPVALHADDVP